jgi:hypothetical protein
MFRTTSGGCGLVRSLNCESPRAKGSPRGVSFELLHFRQLQLVTNRIHDTENIDQIMLEASQDICKLFNDGRLTL